MRMLYARYATSAQPPQRAAPSCVAACACWVLAGAAAAQRRGPRRRGSSSRRASRRRRAPPLRSGRAARGARAGTAKRRRLDTAAGARAEAGAGAGAVAGGVAAAAAAAAAAADGASAGAAAAEHGQLRPRLRLSPFSPPCSATSQQRRLARRSWRRSPTPRAAAHSRRAAPCKLASLHALQPLTLLARRCFTKRRWWRCAAPTRCWRSTRCRTPRSEAEKERRPEKTCAPRLRDCEVWRPRSRESRTQR